MPGYLISGDNQSASQIPVVPSGNISANNVQSALTELDTEKINLSIVDAKGDLIVGSANDSISRLAAGTDGFVLTASAAASGGLTWRAATAGATGGGTDQVFYENGQTITTNYTISTNRNAVTAGPVTINNGVTVTIPNNSVWVIV
jgi:hypothetical protein